MHTCIKWHKTPQHTLVVSLRESKTDVSWCNDKLLGQKTVHYITTCRHTITLYSVWLLFYKGLLEESLRAINQLKLQVSSRDIRFMFFSPIYCIKYIYQNHIWFIQNWYTTVSTTVILIQETKTVCFYVGNYIVKYTEICLEHFSFLE